MDITTLEIPVEEATAALADYEAMIASERTAEDDAIAAGYRAAKRGLPVILLSSTIAAGGVFDNGLPRLAIVRADATECWVHHTSWPGPPSWVYTDGDNVKNMGAQVGAHSVRVPTDVPEPNGPGRQYRRAKTLVPTIPPRLRPRRSRLARRHILWEVEQWAPVPPVDPALVRHIRGDLWAVEAVWDLTPLERAVLSARATHDR